MQELVRHALKLERIGAPADAQALALLAAWQTTRLDAVRSGRPLSESAFGWTSLSLRQHPARVRNPPPPLDELHTLDSQLPPQMRFGALSINPTPPDSEVSFATDAPFDDDPTRAMVLEGMTPVIRSGLSFADALQIADHAGQWARATIQMSTPPDQGVQMLPSDGALWRARLRKQTDFGKPLQTNLVCDETIEITAQGSGQTSGSRRYTYFLYASHDQPDRPRVFEDSGWIELSGDQWSSQIRIKKRVRVSRPTDEALRRLLAAGFLAELWLWAAGLFEVGGLKQERPVPPQQPPGLAKRILPQPLTPRTPGTPKKAQAGEAAQRAASRKHVRVAILGAGPAGLACAWLLSRPKLDDGTMAWEASPGAVTPVFDLTVIEQKPLPGGKAASARHVATGGVRRIEEHGLHVLMGFYANVLGLVKQMNTENLLVDTPALRVPAGAAPGDVLTAWEIAIQPWGKSAPSSPAASAAAPPIVPPIVPAIVPAAAQAAARAVVAAVVPAPAPAPNAANGSAPAVSAKDKADQDNYVKTLNAMTVKARKPLLRSVLFLGRQVQKLVAKRGDAPAAIPSPYHATVLRGLVKSMAFSQVGTDSAPTWTADESPPSGGSLDQIGAMARMMRQFARAALAQGNGAGDLLAAEALELGTTILSGLQDKGLLPTWAIVDPGELQSDAGLGAWALSLQGAFDTMSIRQWLESHGIAPGFVDRSRLLASLTAGLFTTPDNIAAGTFIHGTARLVLDFQGAPFKRMRGGSGEVLIAPLYEALLKKDVQFLFRTTADKLVPGSKPQRIQAVSVTTPVANASYTSFSAASKKRRAGWTVQPKKTERTEKKEVKADAFVLALPPFDGPLPGLPPELSDSLSRIRSRATVAVQSWTNGQPLYPSRIVAPLPTPMRCGAAMEHLQGDEGPGVPFPPVYYCGDLDDAAAAPFATDGYKAWLATNAPTMQQGTQAQTPFVSRNDMRSDRYVCADPGTQAVRRNVKDSELMNLWLAGDWTKGALSCGSIEHAVTSGLEAAASILQSLDCKVNYPIVGSVLPYLGSQEGA